MRTGTSSTNLTAVGLTATTRLTSCMTRRGRRTAGRRSTAWISLSGCRRSTTPRVRLTTCGHPRPSLLRRPPTRTRTATSLAWTRGVAERSTASPAPPSRRSARRSRSASVRVTSPRRSGTTQPSASRVRRSPPTVTRRTTCLRQGRIKRDGCSRLVRTRCPVRSTPASSRRRSSSRTSRTHSRLTRRTSRAWSVRTRRGWVQRSRSRTTSPTLTPARSRRSTPLAVGISRMRWRRVRPRSLTSPTSDRRDRSRRPRTSRTPSGSRSTPCHSTRACTVSLSRCSSRKRFRRHRCRKSRLQPSRPSSPALRGMTRT